MSNLVGEIQFFAGDFAPKGWELCQGQLLAIESNSKLYSIIGNTYGGDGVNNFALPDLRGRIAVGVDAKPEPALPDDPNKFYTLGNKIGKEKHQLTIEEMPEHTHYVSGCLVAAVGDGVTGTANGKALASAGQGNSAPQIYSGMSQYQTHLADGTIQVEEAEMIDKEPPEPFSLVATSVAVNYIIAVDEVVDADVTDQSREGMLGEVVLYAGRNAPDGWMLCHGQKLPMSTNTALLSVLGTTFGGDGRTTFQLPLLQSYSVSGADQNPLGAKGILPDVGRRGRRAKTQMVRFWSEPNKRPGAETESDSRFVSLDMSHLPAHSHSLKAKVLAAPGDGTTGQATDNALAHEARGNSVPDIYNNNKPTVKMNEASIDVHWSTSVKVKRLTLLSHQ